MYRKSPRSAKRSAQEIATLVKELDPPTPFTFERFRAWLEGHSGRSVLLIPTAMPPGAPSGVWLRTNSADYLHYEQRTSSFHQAHIVASLSAHLLMKDVEAEGVSRQLVPDLQLQAGKPLHGFEVSNGIRLSESESFGFEILRRSGLFPGALGSRILLRRLQPLHHALPAAAVDVWAQAGAVRCLYHSVISIRDAVLATGLVTTDESTRQNRPDSPMPISTQVDLRAEALGLIKAADSYISMVINDYLTESSGSLL
jgi:hypothetical protein